MGTCLSTVKSCACAHGTASTGLLVVLDIMMPKMDGIEACLKIREQKNMPIIMLSAKSQDMDKSLRSATLKARARFLW